MKDDISNFSILPPEKQLILYGYKDYFDFFIRIYKKNKLPNIIMLSGDKSVGKATFAYHFINYLLSKNEKNNYSINNFTINPNNNSHKLVCNRTHPNVFILSNSLIDDNIKVDNVRHLVQFLNKTTASNNLKIILIDNIEKLNISSFNALLKSIEEPSSNTFFFLIHNTRTKIPDTIKSRSIVFKIHFNNSKKIDIFNNIFQQYDLKFNSNDLESFLQFETPGTILKYISIFNNYDMEMSTDIISCINFLIKNYKTKKDIFLLSMMSFFIEKFYHNLAMKNYNVSNRKIILLKQIHDIKTYNLDAKNFFVLLKNILENEKA